MIVTIMWNHRTPGIPDEMFERLPNVPITKEEVRTIQISKARLNEGDTIYDIGSGSGSVSVEAAIQVGPSGTVLAVDRDPDAVKLTQANASQVQPEQTSSGSFRGGYQGNTVPSCS